MDLSVWVGAGLGGNSDCRCGILYAPMLGEGGVFFAGLVSLTFPYSSELLLGGGWFASRVSLCVRVRRLGAFGFMEVVF